MRLRLGAWDRVAAVNLPVFTQEELRRMGGGRMPDEARRAYAHLEAQALAELHPGLRITVTVPAERADSPAHTATACRKVDVVASPDQMDPLPDRAA